MRRLRYSTFYGSSRRRRSHSAADLMEDIPTDELVEKRTYDGKKRREFLKTLKARPGYTWTFARSYNDPTEGYFKPMSRPKAAQDTKCKKAFFYLHEFVDPDTGKYSNKWICEDKLTKAYKQQSKNIYYDKNTDTFNLKPPKVKVVRMERGVKAKENTRNLKIQNRKLGFVYKRTRYVPMSRKLAAQDLNCEKPFFYFDTNSNEWLCLDKLPTGVRNTVGVRNPRDFDRSYYYNRKTGEKFAGPKKFGPKRPRTKKDPNAPPKPKTVRVKVVKPKPKPPSRPSTPCYQKYLYLPKGGKRWVCTGEDPGKVRGKYNYTGKPPTGQRWHWQDAGHGDGTGKWILKKKGAPRKRVKKILSPEKVVEDVQDAAADVVQTMEGVIRRLRRRLYR